MYAAVKIQAMNDRNGNPRRGWIVREVREGQAYAEGPVVFVPEGYEHDEARLDREFPSGVVVIATVDVTPGEYRDRIAGIARLA